MINFIICEDNQEIRKMNENIVTKAMFKNDFDYKIYSYGDYSLELKKIIKSSIGKKIYIIDIELGNVSGINIARDIRKVDWESIIIFSTAHSELFPQIFKDRLMIFDFISKYDDYRNSLADTINEIIKIYNFDKFLTFNIRKTIYNIRFKDILYLSYDKVDRKTEIVTLTEKYKVSKSLKFVSKNLPKDFIRINNHCIVNKSNIIKISSKGEIIFINKIKLIDKINNKELISSVLV